MKTWTETIKPSEESDCDPFEEAGYEFKPGFFSRLTGAVIGGGRAKLVIPILFIVIIIVIAISVYAKRNTDSPPKA